MNASNLAPADVCARCLHIVITALPATRSTRRLVVAMLSAAQEDVPSVVAYMPFASGLLL
jgi:hypothetical protein